MFDETMNVQVAVEKSIDKLINIFEGRLRGPLLGGTRTINLKKYRQDMIEELIEIINWVGFNSITKQTFENLLENVIYMDLQELQDRGLITFSRSRGEIAITEDGKRWKSSILD